MEYLVTTTTRVPEASLDKAVEDIRGRPKHPRSGGSSARRRRFRTGLCPAGTEAVQAGQADVPVLCARVFLGLFLSRSDQCAAGDQDNPVILTISPGWLEVMVVLSP